MVRAHGASPARTDFRSFPGRTHWLIAQDGSEEVAQGCVDWIASLDKGQIDAPAEPAQEGRPT